MNKLVIWIVAFAVVVSLFVIFNGMSATKLSPTNLAEDDGDNSPDANFIQGSTINSEESIRLDSGLKISFVDSSPFASVSLSDYDFNLKPIAAARPPISPVNPDSCSDPKVVAPNSNSNIVQGLVDFKGRYIVWEEVDSANPSRSKIQGYDLGPDNRFGTADDMGLTGIMDSQTSAFVPRSGSYGPRVNGQGIVVFEGSDSSNGHTYLLTCSFSDCQPTINIVDSIPRGLGQFFSKDINSNTIVATKNDYINPNARTSSIFMYPISGGQSTLLMQIPLGVGLNIDMFMDAHIDDSGAIAVTKIRGSLFGGVFEEADFFSPGSFSPVNYMAINRLGQIIHSNRAYQIGSRTIAFYENPESGATTPSLFDIAYKIYPTSFLNPFFIYKDNSAHEDFIRGTFNTNLQKFVVGFSSWSRQGNGMPLLVMIYNPQTNGFSQYKEISIPAGYDRYMLGEMDNFNVVSEAMNTNSHLKRVTISEC